MNKKISVLGATGSVGRQALDVARSRGYGVELISANNSVREIESIAREYSVRAVALAECEAAREIKVRLADTDVKVFSGEEGIVEAVGAFGGDTVVNAILGKAGLMPSLAAIDSGKRLALANKESLVVAGDIVMSRARERCAEIIPVDSEHCAIFQSLLSGRQSEIRRLILTASGGPFFGYNKERLASVTLSDTLNHPTWKMGKKITVDSATLMNKGFEIIEAHHLFGVPSDRIDVVVHRQSILHSAVEYIDNSVIGEFSVPDMRCAVQYAVDYPERFESSTQRLDLISLGTLSFAAPDAEAFPFLELAKLAIARGGAMGAVLNASDEVAVGAFLRGELDFLGIMRVVSDTFGAMEYASEVTDLEGIIEIDREARIRAKERISAR